MVFLTLCLSSTISCDLSMRPVSLPNVTLLDVEEVIEEADAA